MQLTRWNPRHRLMRRHSDFSSLFDDFFTPFSADTNKCSAAHTAPSVDIYERDDTIVINAELPGLEKEDINIDVKGKILTLSGERKSEGEIKEENSYRREMRYGRFERSFNLGFEVDPETVEAKYAKGVLTLEVARPQEQEKKQIPIH